VAETRVDLLHLLEDLRDAYPGSIEETILTEIIANSLDSGAARIRITADPASAIAQATASTALENSASTLSPAVLAIRPRCRAIAASRMARWAASMRRVPTSSVSVRRLNPATSAAKTAASLRSIPLSCDNARPLAQGHSCSGGGIPSSGFRAKSPA
jgi:hypothetical protein